MFHTLYTILLCICINKYIKVLLTIYINMPYQQAENLESEIKQLEERIKEEKMEAAKVQGDDDDDDDNTNDDDN